MSASVTARFRVTLARMAPQNEEEEAMNWVSARGAVDKWEGMVGKFDGGRDEGAAISVDIQSERFNMKQA